MGWMLDMRYCDRSLIKILDEFDSIIRDLSNIDDESIGEIRRRIESLNDAVIEYIMRLRDARCSICGDRIRYLDLLAQELIFGNKREDRYCRACAERMGIAGVVDLLVRIAEDLGDLIRIS